MAAIGEIRKRSWLLVVVIVIGMLAFILGDMFNGRGGGGTDPVVATVNGEEVTSLEYQKMVEEEFAKTDQAFQGLNGQPAPSSMKQQISETHMGQYLARQMYKAEYDKLGIAISDEEFNDLLQGNNVDGQLYEPYGFFVGPDRKFSQDSLNKQLPQALQNPNFQFFFEKIIGEQAEVMQLQNKYFNMIEKGLYVTQYEAKRDFQANGNTANFDFVYAPFTSVTPEEANVTEADMKAYYNAHKNEKKYEQEDKVDFQYIEFQVDPSEEDLAAARGYLVDRVQRFRDADNDTTFVLNNSDTKNIEFGKGNFPAEMDSIVNASAKDSVIGPYRDGDYFKIAKVISNTFKPQAEVRHILIGNNKFPEEARRKQLADSITRVVKGNKAKFEEMVTKFSTDLGSVQNGGKYEWFDKGRMVAEFEDVSFNKPVGSVHQATTQYGIHIIEVLGQRNQKELIVATVDSEIARSRATINAVRDKAMEFINSFENTNISDSAFRNAATKLGIAVNPANDVLLSMKDMPEFGTNFEQVKKWVFSKNTDEGDLSDELVFDDKIVVAHLTSKSASGVPTWDELSENTKSSIEFEVMNEKKAKILAEKMKGATLADIAAEVKAEVKTSNNTTLATSNIEGVGNEPAVVGRAFGLTENEVSSPVVGNTGVFVVMLKSVTESPLPESFDQQKQAAQGQLRGQAKQRANQALVETSGMEDNREKVNIIGN